MTGEGPSEPGLECLGLAGAGAELISATSDSWCTLEGDVPATAVHGLRQQIPPLTRGEGVMESCFDRYEPVRGQAPTRPRTDDNPLSRDEYLHRVVRRGS